MIRQIIKSSVLISLIVTASLWVLKKDIGVLGFVLGSLWGCLNLYLIEVLIKAALMKKNVLMSSGLILIKFPLLYWIGYKLLTLPEVNPWYMTGGLSLIFMVAVVRALIPMDERLA